MRITRWLSALVVLALVAAGVALLVGRPGPHRLTAIFPSTVSLYRGAKVEVLGVPVGRVESIRVVGARVRVEMSYRSSLRLPADVGAVIVPPSVVGDRYVQLTPVYRGGPVLAEGAVLPRSRTAVPLELDDTYRSLDKLARSLGPQGANKDGALSRFVSAAADNLRGRGQLFRRTLRDFTRALDTFASSRSDVSGTVAHLQRLNRALVGNDPQLRALVTNLALVSVDLSHQRGDIDTAVHELSSALGAVATFARTHRAAVRKDIAGLARTSALLARHSRDLSEATDIAPVGLVSLMNIYVPRNWDPDHPYATGVEGRTGSQALHAVALNDLDIELGFALAGVCADLPAAQRAAIGSFCTALHSAGNNLGTVLGQAYAKGAGR